MNKYRWLILVVMALNFGCVTKADLAKPITWEKAKYIQNLNMFDFGIGFGRVKIVLDKSFVPVGNLGEDVSTLDFLAVARYVFIDESVGRDNVKRAIVIYQYQIIDKRRCMKFVSSFEKSKNKYFAKGKMKLDGVDVSYVVRQIPYNSKTILKLMDPSPGFQMDKSITYATSFRLAIPIKGYFPLQKIIEVEYVEGGTTNYVGESEEVKEFMRRVDTHITLIRKKTLW